MLRERILYTTWIVVVLVAASCGSGGTPETRSDTGNPVAEGSAAIGVLWKGTILAEELDSRGTPVRVIGGAVTDREGGYSLILDEDYQGGPIRIGLSSGVESLMRCNAPIYISSTCGRHTGQNDVNANGLIDRGEWFAPGEFSMAALLPQAAPSEHIAVSITPFTDLAASRAMATGFVTAETVNSANYEVSYLLGGLNIIHTPVIDLMDSTAVDRASRDSLYYSALSAGMITLAGVEPSTGQPSLAGALDNLATGIQGGRLPAVPSADATSLSELLQAAERQLDSLGRADLSGMMSTAGSLVAGSSDGYVYPPSELDLPVDGVERVKALVGEIRNWGSVISDEGYRLSDSLQNKARIARKLFENSSGGLTAVLSAAVQAVSESHFQNADLAALTLPGITEAEGAIVADSHNAALELTGTFIPESDNQPYTVYLKLMLKSFSEVQVTGEIQGSSGTLEIRNGSLFYSLLNGGEIRMPYDSSIHLDAVLRQTVLIDTVPTGFTYAGNFGCTLQAVESGGALNEAQYALVLTSMKLDGHFSQQGEQEFDAVLAAELNAIDPQVIPGENHAVQDIIASVAIEEPLDISPPTRFTLYGVLSKLSEQPSSLSISKRGCPLNIEVGPESAGKYSLNFSNCFGATLSVLMPDGIGEAMYNDRRYGMIEKVRNMLKVNYVDGSFETIF